MLTSELLIKYEKLKVGCDISISGEQEQIKLNNKNPEDLKVYLAQKKVYNEVLFDLENINLRGE